MAPAPVKPAIALDILGQNDVRVGTIESISDLAGFHKLVALRVHFGDHWRAIVAGLKQERSSPREIEGHQALFVINLEPRKMGAVVYESMLFDIGYAEVFALWWRAGIGRARWMPRGINRPEVEQHLVPSSASKQRWNRELITSSMLQREPRRPSTALKSMCGSPVSSTRCSN